jgi:hypothetical protein
LHVPSSLEKAVLTFYTVAVNFLNQCDMSETLKIPERTRILSNVRRRVIWVILYLFPVCVSAQTQGFFLNDLPSKVATYPGSSVLFEKPAATTVSVSLDFEDVVAEVPQYIYGHNGNIYMTQMVDQPELLERIKELSPNVIRYPGGNLSSIFFWNAEKDSPPSDAPANLVDASGSSIPGGYWYGKNSEGWTQSVDNYYQMLDLTNSTGMITVNYGYARYSTATNPVASAAHLAAEWVRYDNGRTKFWEIGNESNGSWQVGYRIKLSDNKDGQPEIMNGELYGKHFTVFADSMRKAAEDVGATIYIGAQLLAETPASWWNNTDRFWNDGVFKETVDIPDYYIIHSYYTPYATNSNASEILASPRKVTADMMSFVTSQQVNANVKVKPIALTEWNIFAEGSKQQASYINGMHAVLTLGELIRNQYGMAARWDLANGWANGNDHGIFNQGDEPNVPKWNPRAPFYYMTLFQRYFGDEMIGATVSGSTSVFAYGSRFSSGEASAVIINTGSKSETIDLDVSSFGFGENFYVYSLTGGSDNGEFSLRVLINGKAGPYASGGPLNLNAVAANRASLSDGIRFSSPPRSVQFVLVENGDNVITSVEESAHMPAVFPNPADGELTIRLAGGEPVALEVIDARGVTLYRAVFDGEYTIPDRMLPKGIVVVKLNRRGKIYYKKVLVR